jgi:F-type H+-transporting ATPase subunit delta
MNNSKIAVRYAKAFFELGIEKNKLDDFRKDIDFIAGTIKQNDIQLLIESPVVKTSEKKKIFTDIFGKKIQELSLKFLLMIIDNRRETHIADICRNFTQQYLNHKGIKAATVTTATPIDEELQNKITKVIADIFKTDIELTTIDKQEIIGGFILRVGDKQLDASVSGKLSKIKREFLNKQV